MSAADELKRRLDQHFARLRTAAAEYPLLDLGLAERIHGRMSRVVQRWDELGSEQRDLVSEVVDYVVTDDDEEHDIRSPIGLEDDEERVAELERRLGLSS